MPSCTSSGVAASPNSRIVKRDGITLARNIVNPNGSTTQIPRLKSYSKVANYLLKHYINDQKLEEAGDATSRYTQPADMMPLRYEKGLFC